MMISPCLYKNDTFRLQIPMCLLHIQFLTPEGSNWVLALHLWTPSVTLWVGWGQESSSSPLVESASLSRIRGLDVCMYLGRPLSMFCPASVTLSGCVCFSFQMVTCGERDATFSHPCSKIFQIPTMFQCWAEPRRHSEMSKPWCSPSEPRRDVGRAQGSLQCKTEFKCEAREAGVMTTSGKEKHQSPRWPGTVVELAVSKRARTWGKAKTWRCGMWGPHYFGHMHVFHTRQNPIQVIWIQGVLPTPPTFPVPLSLGVLCL